MKSLDKAIRLWMKCCCFEALSPQLFEEVGENVGLKLSTLICDNALRNAKSSYPIVNENVNYCLGRNGTQRKSFGPARVSIDDCEDV